MTKVNEKNIIDTNNINAELNDYNVDYKKATTIINENKSLKNEIIMKIISLMIKDSKNQLLELPYGYNKKGALILSKIKLEKNLNNDFKAIIKATYIYLVSKSKINFNDKITKSNFIKGMNLLNLDNNDKYNSNKQLIEAVKNDTLARKIKSATKLLSK